MSSPELFRSDFLKTASTGLRRRRDYGSEPAPVVAKLAEDANADNLYRLKSALQECRESLRRAGIYSFDTPWNNKLRLCYGAIDEILVEVEAAIPYRSIGGPTASKQARTTPPGHSLFGMGDRQKELLQAQENYNDVFAYSQAHPGWLKKDLSLLSDGAIADLAVRISKTAATGSAPREYPVRKKHDGFWYVIGLPGEELAPEDSPSPTVSTPDSWLNVHQQVKNLDLAEQLYRELYAEFQTNDNLKAGDVFSTPIGKFVCEGVDVLPYDDLAKKAIAEVDESYKCKNCECDQGKHLKKYDDNGYPYYGECTEHPQCKEYTKGGGA
jgi:hypothetical protein